MNRPSVDLHPEGLLDRERRGLLSPDERGRLVAHRRVCGVCALEHHGQGDLESEMAEADSDAALLARIVSRTLAPDRAAPVARRAGAMRVLSRAAVAALLVLFASGSAAALWMAFTGRPRAPEVDRPPIEPRPAADGLAAPARGGPAPQTAADGREAPPATSVPSDRARPPRAEAHGLASTPEPSASPPTGTADPASPPAAPDAASVFALANEARRRQDDLRAIALYRELQSTFPASREAVVSRVSLGRLLLHRSNDAAGALAQFDAYLAGRDDALREEALFGRAVALERSGRAGEALAAWASLLAAHPTSVYTARARERIQALGGR